MKGHFKAFPVLAMVFITMQVMGCGGSGSEGEGCDDIEYNMQAPPDTDGDGIADNMDNCVGAANSDQADADGDMVGDACDKCADQKERFCNGETEIPLDSCITFSESRSENCAVYWNVNQCTNTCDGNEIDGCAEAQPPEPPVDADKDGDGIPDEKDNCPDVPNKYQLEINDDWDNDGIGNECDSDADGDGVEKGKDNCETIPNPDQADWDNDGVGDKCDADYDNDGIKDGFDNCPTMSNPEQTDTDGDFAGDACDDAMIAAKKLTSFNGGIYAIEKGKTIFKLGDKTWDAVAGKGCDWAKYYEEGCYNYEDMKVINNRLHMLTSGDGLFKYNEKDGSLAKVGQGLEGLWFWDGAVSEYNEKLVVAASQSGIYYLDNVSGEWKFFGPDVGFGTDKHFTDLIEYEGHLYVGTESFMYDQGKGLFVFDAIVKNPTWLSANAYQLNGQVWAPVPAVETQEVYGFEVIEKGVDSGLYAIARNPFHAGSARLFKIVDHKMYEFDSPKALNDKGESELEYTDVVHFDGTFYVATEYNGVWKREGAGDWKQMKGLGTEEGAVHVRSLVVHEGKLYAAIAYWAHNFNFDGLFVLDNDVWMQMDGGK